jgi:hypothetical protein
MFIQRKIQVEKWSDKNCAKSEGNETGGNVTVNKLLFICI